MAFYYHYLSTFPDYFKAEEHPNGRLMGYIMGKAEGEGELWHGYVPDSLVVANTTVLQARDCSNCCTRVPTTGLGNQANALS